MSVRSPSLQERKRSLITAAVTGEFDVTAASVAGRGVSDMSAGSRQEAAFEASIEAHLLAHGWNGARAALRPALGLHPARAARVRHGVAAEGVGASYVTHRGGELHRRARSCSNESLRSSTSAARSTCCAGREGLRGHVRVGVLRAGERPDAGAVGRVRREPADGGAAGASLASPTRGRRWTWCCSSTGSRWRRRS